MKKIKIDLKASRIVTNKLTNDMSYQSYNPDNTVLTEAEGYEVNNMVFQKASKNSIPNSKPEMFYHRINIGTQNPDGSVGDLVLPTDERFSFGISENTDPTNPDRVTGYSMGLCMWTRPEEGGPFSAEVAWTDTFEKIIDHCKQHLLAHKEEIERWDLDEADLKKFGNCLYRKKDKGKIVEGVGPTLYVKLMTQKKGGMTITTKFYKPESDDEWDPLEFKGHYCKVVGAVKVESIYVGSKISLIVKLKEAEAQLCNQGQRRLLPSRPASLKRVSVSTTTTPHDVMGDDEEPEGEQGEEEPEGGASPQAPRAVAKAAPKRVVTRVVRRAKTTN